MFSTANIKLSLRATIGEYEFHDISQFVSTFALNSIPSASLRVAIGRDMRTGELATIHKAAKFFRSQQPVSVYLRATVRQANGFNPGLPNKEIKIFEGRTTGISWQRNDTAAHYTISVLHWLGDLNYASAMSASSHPGNPQTLVYPGVYGQIGPSGQTPAAGVSQANDPSWVPLLSSSLVDTASMSDVWGEILHKWFTSLVQEDPFELQLGSQTPGKPDPDIVAAVSRLGPNSDGVPLDLNFEGLDGEIIAAGIRKAIADEAGGNWVNTTLWGKLVGEFAPSYWFSVVPRITDGLVVPFTGGLSGDPWAVIKSDSYVAVDVNTQLQQVLRAIGILAPTIAMTGYDLGLNVALDAGGCAGWYQPEDLTSGMVMIKDAPKWLSDPVPPGLFGSTAEGIGQKTVTTSADEVDSATEREAPYDAAAAMEAHNTIMSRYAHQWYVIEALRGRAAEIAGKLRFDIAPGSNILLKAAGSRNVPDVAEVTEDFYATVTQVACVINVEGQQAATTFSLAHVRTAAENTSPSSSIDRPPLYRQAWRGATLVADPDIKPET